MKIGIFGGTFDPVHNEHIKMAEEAIDKLNLDKLIVVPTFIPPHKDTVPAPAGDRIEMLKLAFNGNEKVEVSDFEVQNGGKSYSFLTVLHFKELYKTDELFFFVGKDMLADFKTWKNPEIILENATLVAFNREGYGLSVEKDFKLKFGKDYILLDYTGKDISSTEIRVYSSLGLDITKLTDEKVCAYIREKDLYQGDLYSEFVKNNLTEKRLIHTANVVIAAVKWAKPLKLSQSKVYISALLHDCAKYLNKKDFPLGAVPSDVPTPVEHAFLGAYVAENVLKIKDMEIIDAIRYHTSGKADMSDLSKLIFVADMVEKGRTYEGVTKLREIYERDFDKCFLECLKEEYLHLLNRGDDIYYQTVNAYKYYIKD